MEALTTTTGGGAKVRTLDATRLTDEQRAFAEFLDANMSGQPEAKAEMVELLGQIRNPLRNKKIPLSRILVGPSTSGKTLAVKLLVKWVNGSDDKMGFFQGSEYMEKHQLSRLLGAPPGYIGHVSQTDRKTPPAAGKKDTAAELSQHNLDNALIGCKDEKTKVLFLLFDEFEKFHWDFSLFMLGVLREGRATLGDLTESVFENCVIFFTSNLGSEELDRMATPMGFASKEKKVITVGDVRTVVVRELKRGYVPEFRNRIGKVIFFRALTDTELTRVVSLEVNKLQSKILELGAVAFILSVDDNAKLFLLKANNDEESEKGAIPLMQERLEAWLSLPLGNAIQLGLLHLGDMVTVTHKEGDDKLTFEVIESEPVVAAAAAAVAVDQSAEESQVAVVGSEQDGAASEQGVRTDQPAMVPWPLANAMPGMGLPGMPGFSGCPVMPVLTPGVPLSGTTGSPNVSSATVRNSIVVQDFVITLQARTIQEVAVGKQAISNFLLANQIIQLKEERTNYEQMAVFVTVLAPIELMYALKRAMPGVTVHIVPGVLE